MILNLSEAFNIAIHALALLASEDKTKPLSTSAVAESLSVSEAHLSKVFQRLTKAGLVKPVRGPKGGFTLAREPKSVKLLEIHKTIDGTILNGSGCVHDLAECTRCSCVFGNLLSSIDEQVSEYFTKTTLADLAESA